MEPLFWRAVFENTMRKRSTYTTLTLELRMQLSFNSSNNHRLYNLCNNARVSTPASRIRPAYGLRALIYTGSTWQP